MSTTTTSSSNQLIDGTVTSFESLKHAVVQQQHQDGDVKKRKAVLLFGTTWHESCMTLKMVLEVLAQEKTDILFFYIDAEASSELSDDKNFNVTSVPTVILLNGLDVTDDDNDDKLKYNILERLEGGVLEPAQVTLAVQRLVVAPEGGGGSTVVSTDQQPQQSTQQAVAASSSLNDRLEKLVRGDQVMVFMKGTPTAPRCGFSRQAVELLQSHNVPFGCFDILTDDEVRQGLKAYSDWPTYPQIYVKGELIGGLDILKETAEGGPLKEQWNITDDDSPSSATTASSLHDRLTNLVNRSPTMLFMKGLPSAPKCGFSRRIVEILDETGAAYDAFNILDDEEVRQGLKEFSDWPTYPQLYHNGELLGGLDIVEELKESGELGQMLSSSS